MLVIEAKSAMAPRIRMRGGWSAPVTMIEPTTAMAEMALVMRHQRGVQQPGDPADHSQPDERGQHEDEEHGPEIERLSHVRHLLQSVLGALMLHRTLVSDHRGLLDVVGQVKPKRFVLGKRLRRRQ